MKKVLFVLYCGLGIFSATDAYNFGSLMLTNLRGPDGAWLLPLAYGYAEMINAANNAEESHRKNPEEIAELLEIKDTPHAESSLGTFLKTFRDIILPEARLPVSLITGICTAAVAACMSIKKINTETFERASIEIIGTEILVTIGIVLLQTVMMHKIDLLVTAFVVFWQFCGMVIGAVIKKIYNTAVSAENHAFVPAEEAVRRSIQEFIGAKTRMEARMLYALGQNGLVLLNELAKKIVPPFRGEAFRLGDA